MPTSSKIESWASLQAYNSFGLEAKAEALLRIRSEADWRFALSQEQSKKVLGGGSNILFRSDVEGLLLKNELPLWEVLSENEKQVKLRVGGGHGWHETVRRCVEQGWGGLENLSLIPGTVGAAPIQNIGAYGVELKDHFEGLWAWHLQRGEQRYFDKKDCAFGYRDSLFKREEKGQWLIAAVDFRLDKKPVLRLDYAGLRETLAEQGIEQPTVQEVSDAVIAIRRRKLPQPRELGNAGSFFKNPIVSTALVAQLQKEYPDMPHYPLERGEAKIPAAWLIEQCGWKGKRQGAAGIYEKHALILVNHGGATGQGLWALAQAVIESVEKRFGIRLQAEVNLW